MTSLYWPQDNGPRHIFLKDSSFCAFCGLCVVRTHRDFRVADLEMFELRFVRDLDSFCISRDEIEVFLTMRE